MIDLEHVWIITTGTGSQRTDPLNSTSYKGAAFRIWACRKLLHNVFMTEPVVWADRSVGVCHVRLPCSYRSPEWTNGLCNTCDIHTLMAEAAVLTRSSLGFSIFLNFNVQLRQNWTNELLITGWPTWPPEQQPPQTKSLTLERIFCVSAAIVEEGEMIDAAKSDSLDV